VALAEREASDLEGNDELRDDSVGGDAGAAHEQDQARFRDEAQRGLDQLPVAEPKRPNQENDQPGGASGDKAASQKAAKKDGSPGGGSGTSAGGSPGGGAGGLAGKALGGGKGSASSKAKKKLAIGIASAGFSLIVAVAGFLGLLADKLIHLEENITHYFDKRIEHTLQQEASKGWQKVSDDDGKEAPDEAGHPIADAYAGIDQGELASDLNVSIDRNPDGTWKDFVEAGGEKVAADDTALADPNSPVEDDIGSRFPSLDFFRLSIRSRIIDATFGIVRKFLPSEDEPSSDDTATIQQEQDQETEARINDTDGAPVAAEVSSAESEAQSVTGEEAKAEGTDAAEEAAEDSILIQACAVEQIANTIVKTAPLVREAALMRYAFIILATADQLKRGDLHPAQLAVFMKALSGFEKSGGWQRITGGDKSAKISNIDNYSLNPTNGTSVGKVNGILSAIPGFSAACGAISSTTGTILGILATIVPGLDVSVEGFDHIVQSALQFVGFAALADVVTKIGMAEVSNSFLNNSMPADQRVDATIAGYDSYSQANERSNGGERLTPQQVSVLNDDADQTERQEAMQQHSLAYRLFSPNYDQSLVSQLINRTPTDPTQMAVVLNSKFTALFNPFAHNQVLAFEGFISPSAYADDGADDQEDPSGFGAAQFGLPDSLINNPKYSNQTTNEDAVISYLCAHPDAQDNPADTAADAGLYNGECAGTSTDSSGELTEQDDSHADLYHDFVAECLTSVSQNESNNLARVVPGGDDDGYLNDPACSPSTHDDGDGSDAWDRFRVYRSQLGVANMIKSYNNTNDDQNPAGSGGSSAPGGSTTPGPPAGSASCNTLQSCAQQIQQLHSAGKISYAVDADQIQANITLEASGQDPKFDGDGETITTASPYILEAVVTLAQQGTVELNSYIDGESHTASDNPHHMGEAIDIGAFNGTTLGSPNIAQTKQVEQIVGTVLPQHSRFGADFYTDATWTSPINLDGKVFYTGQDAPAHLHFDVVGASS
jgi:hypothetical protein